MKKVFTLLLVWVCLLFVPLTVFAGAQAEAEKLLKDKNYSAAADLLAKYVNSEEGKSDAGAIYKLGSCLEELTEQINTDAEQRCYRSAGASHSPACMQKYAAEFNAKYGAGSFVYEHDIITIRYTGIQYDQLLKNFPDSEVAAEADYHNLGKQLKGGPDEVLARINSFLSRHPTGKWHNKGLLVLARVNEDIWFIHRNWPWVLYNWQTTPEDMIIRSEPYRQAAIAAYKQIKGGEEGKFARKEAQLLDDYKSDKKIYSIVNESNINGVNTETLPQQKEAKQKEPK